ncbi:hypothetical protein FS842_009240, partial [Serendipita sp. 407]
SQLQLEQYQQDAVIGRPKETRHVDSIILVDALDDDSFPTRVNAGLFIRGMLGVVEHMRTADRQTRG